MLTRIDTETPSAAAGRRRRPATLLLAAVLAGLSLLAGGAATAGPGSLDPLAPGLLADPEAEARESAIQALTRDTVLGMSELAGHYVRGGTDLLPPESAVEFLLLRSVNSNQAPLRDAALAPVAAWSAIALNDYLKWGLPDSTMPGVPPGRKIKRAVDEASLLKLFLLAWQASGKEMFQEAARKTRDDLAGWWDGPGRFAAWTANEPDTTFGPPIDPERMAAIAAILISAETLVGPRGGPAPAGNPMSRLPPAVPPDPSPARRLLAIVDAAAFGAGGAGQAAERAREIMDRAATPPQSPDDSAAAAWSALALVRYAAFAHDDSALAAARTCLSHLRLESPASTRVMKQFAARAAAGAALELLARPAPMAYIVGDPAAPATAALLQGAVRAYRPGKLIAVHSPDGEDLLYPPSGDGVPIVYVCSGELCAPPTAEAGEARTLVESFALPGRDGLSPGPGH